MKYIKYLVTIIILFNMCGCYSNDDAVSYVKNKINFDLSACTISHEEDTHGGFLGDGEYILMADCANKTDINEQISSWNKLPLSNNLELIMYGGMVGDYVYGYDFAKKYNIPVIENGYYYFINRHSNAISPSNDENLFNEYSFNFSLALYDSDTNMFYYFELDT